jgi:FtsP/CotA-like multicopper oxidase with cupredoxin domain
VQIERHKSRRALLCDIKSPRAAGRVRTSSAARTAEQGVARLGTTGRVDPKVNGFDPGAILRDFDEGTVRNGVREWEIVAEEREIEVAPGVRYAAWTYHGRVPGPTLRAREGERLRVKFINGATHPHTMHFHGIHTAAHDGVPGIGPGNILPGESFDYEFDATPFGLHLYHCHTTPLAEHIVKGL